ncbi:MAG TPA: Ku protein [Nannocystaceae bacterium]|nr:Ku protein [Nannocystaceae bacterium]
MARAIWKGTISFGLVEIPISLVKAEDTHELDLHLVDRRDHAPIRYQRINESTGEVVEWENIVKAHEEGGELVLLSDDELANANVDAVKRIEILDFVDGADIHPSYYHRPYWLEPGRKQGAKAYVLLRKTLQRTGKVGIAVVVMRTRQHLAALTVKDDALALVLLRFADELRGTDKLELPADDIDVKPKELEMAEQLVASMDAQWEPEKYEDSYYNDVLAMIAKKRKEGETEPLEVAEPAARPGTAVVDLMPLLQKSMEERKGGKPRTAARKTARPAAHGRKTAARKRVPSAARTTKTRTRSARSRKSA